MDITAPGVLGPLALDVNPQSISELLECFHLRIGEAL
jgi:hypothetical protein